MALAGCAVLVLMAAVVWTLCGRSAGEGAPGRTRNALIADAGKAGKTATNGVPVKAGREVLAEFREKAKEFVRRAATNDVSWTVPALAPDDPDRALLTRVSCELSLLLAIRPGEQLLPFPFAFMDEEKSRQAAIERGEEPPRSDGGNAEFEAALAKFKIRGKETDSDERLAFKEQMLSAQAELLQSLDEGSSVNDVIKAAWEFRERAYRVRQESVAQLTEYLEESQDVERTRQLLADYNSSLKENGIIEIPEEEIGIETPEEEGTD